MGPGRRMPAISAWALLLARSNATLFREAGGSNVTEDPEDDPCRCLNWQNEVYTRHVCGMSNEYFFVTGNPQPAPEHALMVRMSWHQYCDRFYMKMDNNICFNINIGHDRGQWCFVDSRCHDLNGGGLVTKQPTLRWKKCAPGADAMFRDRTLEEVIQFTQKYDVSFNIAGQLAWPSYPVTKGVWKNLKGYFLPSQAEQPGGDYPFDEEHRAALDQLAVAGGPFMIDTNYRHSPPQVVVDNGKLYEVKMKTKKPDLEHPGGWCDVAELDATAKIVPPGGDLPRRGAFRAWPKWSS